MTDPFADLTAAQRQQIREAHAAKKEAQHPELTLDEVRQRVAAIVEADRADDDAEGTHYEQDELYEEVLRVVAAGHPDGAAMAAECVRIADGDGTRWYAGQQEAPRPGWGRGYKSRREM